MARPSSKSKLHAPKQASPTKARATRSATKPDSAQDEGTKPTETVQLTVGVDVRDEELCIENLGNQRIPEIIPIWTASSNGRWHDAR